MKKRLFAVLTAVMVLTFGITANAAESSTTTNTSTAAPSTVTINKDGATSATTGVNISESSVSNEQVTAGVQATIGASYAFVDVKSVFDLTNNGAAIKNTDNSYTVTIRLPGLTARPGYKYYLLHYIGDGWEVLSATVGNGTITFNTFSFSPFALVEVSDEPEWAATVRAYGTPWPYDDAAATTNTASVAAPKTGEGTSVLMVVMLAAAVATLFASRKYIKG